MQATEEKYSFLKVLRKKLGTLILNLITVMVHLICQFDWASRCLSIWSNIILCVSVRVCWMRFRFKSTDWVKQIPLPHPTSWMPEQQNDWPSYKREWARPWAYIYPAFSSNYIISSSWIWSLLAFRLELHHQLFLVLRPLDSDWNYTISFPAALRCWLQIWKFLSSHNCMNQYPINYFSLDKQYRANIVK